MKRAILIVLDGCGAGEAPDAGEFGDLDHPATVRHVWEAAGGLNTPNLESLGFLEACGVETNSVPKGRCGQLQELSQGKDSVTGHWEMMGVITERPFPTYPRGFPPELVEQFETEIGRKVLGNKPASGTAIIQEFGPEHIESGNPILYTSADSVWQIACHESIVPLATLYDWCQLSRNLCVAPNDVQRIIARPFIGSLSEGFRRTEHRKDFPLEAPLNLVDRIGDVYGIGPVPELFGGRGFRSVRRTQNNAEHALALWEALESDARFIFANFEDFDMLYGHRNDPIGFARALESFDITLGEMLDRLLPNDLLVITADHGNDPTTSSTDHSREFVPLVLYGDSTGSGSLGTLAGFDTISRLIADHLGIGGDTPQLTDDRALA
jgi:phosphopentomutase